MEEDITLSSLFHWQPRSHKTCSLWKISLTIFKEMHSSTRCIYYSPRPPTTHLPSTPLQPLEPSTISSTTLPCIKAQATHPPLWVPVARKCRCFTRATHPPLRVPVARKCRCFKDRWILLCNESTSKYGKWKDHSVGDCITGKLLHRALSVVR